MPFVLFVLFSVLELFLLIKVGGKIGALNMTAWVFASALIGMWAVRAQGQSALRKVRAEQEAGRIPQHSVLDGMLLFFGGILLIVPGLISDALGLFLLIPPFRHLATRSLAARFSSRQSFGQSFGGAQMFFFKGSGFQRPDANAAEEPCTGRGAESFAASAPHLSDKSPRQAVIIESSATVLDKDGASSSGKA